MTALEAMRDGSSLVKRLLLVAVIALAVCPSQVLATNEQDTNAQPASKEEYLIGTGIYDMYVIQCRNCIVHRPSFPSLLLHE